MKAILHLIILLVIFSSCSNNEENQELIRVIYGTSFGMCFGYCINELEIKSGFIVVRKEGWNDSVEQITCSDTLEEKIWAEINDFNQIDSFFQLPEILGCPDCADGGAEWVEIELANGEKHKVTFEYFKHPDVLKDYIVILRSQLNMADTCGEF